MHGSVQLSPFRGALAALFVFALFPGQQFVRAGATEEIAAFSEFREVDLAKLAGGKALTAQGASMSGFPRGMTVQACYLMPLPLQKAVEAHKQFNAARHSELKVYLHRDLPAKPALADFQVLSGAPKNGAVRALVEATEKLGAGPGTLQLSEAEAKQFGKADGTAQGSFPAPVAAFWSNLLYQRTMAFLSGGVAKEPGYDSGGETVRASEEMTHLLKSQPKVRAQFQPVLDVLGGGGGKPALSFELFDVERRGAFTLGASYSKPVKDGWQNLDVQYYGSDGYYVLLSFYQFWPVATPSGPATLVWRGDMLSSASLADLHGIERAGSAAAMKKEIQKSIGFLQADAVGR